MLSHAGTQAFQAIDMGGGQSLPFASNGRQALGCTPLPDAIGKHPIIGGPLTMVRSASQKNHKDVAMCSQSRRLQQQSSKHLSSGGWDLRAALRSGLFKGILNITAANDGMIANYLGHDRFAAEHPLEHRISRAVFLPHGFKYPSSIKFRRDSAMGEKTRHPVSARLLLRMKANPHRQACIATACASWPGQRSCPTTMWLITMPL